MGLYERVAGLELTVETVTLDRLERETSSGFVRTTTTFSIGGDGTTGRGEDVTYDTEDHDRLADDPPALPTGTFTLAEFSRALEECSLFPREPEQDASRPHRRWAVESAALDLGLRQAGTTLADALDRTYDPVRFVVSTRLGEAGFDRIERILDANPDAEFKLDPTAEWTADLAERLASTDRVRVLDLKGHYRDADVGGDPDPDLYRLVVDQFPDVIIEDPLVTDGTRPVLTGEEERLSWDSPVTGVEAVEALPVEPSWLNLKPSRFGTVRSLLDTIEYCEDRDIRTYGGGQFELGVGRDHVQALASVFSPEAPNDVAPPGYNDPDLSPSLPASPLHPTADMAGLAWR